MDESSHDESPQFPPHVELWFQNAEQVMTHPAFARLRSILNITLAADASAVFQLAHNLYNNPSPEDPFEQLRRRKGEKAAHAAVDSLVTDVQEGLRSCAYYLSRFQELEQQVEQLVHEFSSDLMEGIEVEGERHQVGTIGIPSQTLVAEYAAFTLMSRATLDWLNRFLGRYFEFEAGNLYKLQRVLANNRPKDVRAHAVVLAIERHKAYLDTQIALDKSIAQTERDRLAHYGYVLWTAPNILCYSDGSVEIISPITHPTLDSQERASTVLRKRFELLQSTIIDIVNSFLRPQ